MALAKDRMRTRHIDSLQGWVSYARMRYRCHACAQTYYPLDRELALHSGSRMSQQKEHQLALLSVRLPYAEAKAVYEALTGLTVGRMTAHRVVQRLGGRAGEVNGSVPATAKPEAGGKTHITADGVMIHLRGEGWKEAKVGAVYEVDDSRETAQVRYTATVESRDVFGEQLYELSGRPEARDSAGMVFISDAAMWLGELHELLFPLATRIIDFWHVTEYVWAVANSFYPEGTARAQAWAAEHVTALRQGQARRIQERLAQMRPTTKHQREVLDKARTYFENHSHEMDYPRYEHLGYHIGSGIAEAACKHVIQSRFKRSGMRWSRPGAENLLRLRLAYLNHQWDDWLAVMRN